MIYRKLTRVWSHNNMNYIPRFKETFPELNKLSSEELSDRWIELGIDFYTQEKETVNPLVRATMPFAIILMLLMTIGIPFVFLLTGKWSYPLGSKNRIVNWFRSLHLLS